MKYRRLGGTDIDVSVICHGPMRLAQSPDDNKAKVGETALRHAIDCGVNFLHSSYEYGTRWLMEKVLKGHPKRSDLHHIIKVPVPDFKDRDMFDPVKFTHFIDEALRDLHAERISVLQYITRSDPNVDDRTIPLINSIVDDVIATFEKLRDQGKVGYLYQFCYTPAFAQESIKIAKAAGLIAYYNPIEMEMADFFGDLEKNGMGFICIRPFYEGILTDKYADQPLLPESHRLRAERYKNDFIKRQRIVETFREEIAGSMTDFAIRFALASPVVGSLVVGLNTPEQVDEVLAAAEREVCDLETVRKGVELHRSGFGI